jgi:DnaJ-class molecular chaperone
MSNRDPYVILEVDPKASDQEIKDSYRRIVRECHPDLNGAGPRGDNRIKEVNWAYGILGDSRKKYEFDKSTGFFRPHESKENEYPNQTVYGNSRPRGPVRPEPEDLTPDPLSRIRPRRGSDLTHELTITFDQAMAGAPIEAEIAGKIVRAQIPAGVDTGSIIHLEGAGAPGLRGGPRGDLYLLINVMDDQRFLRRGKDVFATVPITKDEARTGAIMEVPAPQGVALLKVPPNTADETMFRFKGRGFPCLNGAKRGDYFVRARIV